MLLTIQTGQDNPILRQKTNKVKRITPEIKELILNMIETMDAKQGIGLAAPQVGQSLQIITIRPDPQQPAIVLINPEIIKKSFKKDIVEEGCLSLPSIQVEVKRPVSITVKAININNEQIKIKTDGLLSRVIQHEIDHLNGILIVDKK
ncbi:peptide deformylase [Patescibacteria group bacterium]